MAEQPVRCEELQKVSPSEFRRCVAQIVSRVKEAVKSGVRNDTLNELVNKAIEDVNDLAEKLNITDADIDEFGTVMMKAVYRDFGDNDAVVKDLRSGVKNMLKTAALTQILDVVLRPELEPYVKELADVLVDAYRRGGLEEAASAAYEYFTRARYKKKRLVDYLFTEAPDSLQHKSKTMQKFSRTALATCPGADVCAAQCYALHGNYVQMQVKRAIAARDVFVSMLQGELTKRVSSDAADLPVPALTAGLLGAAFAGGVRAAGFGEFVRLHDAGDFSDVKYLAAWLAAAKLMPDKQIYTYTKTFPNVPGMPPVWQKAVNLYRDLFGEQPLPRNFAVNISATATNYKYIAEAAETLTKLGINVPGVFFYASANMDEYYKDEEGREKEERWRGLAKSLLETAVATTDRKLVLEFEHGLGAKRSAKSSHHVVKLVNLLTDYAEKNAIPLRVSVPKTAYKVAELKDEEKRRLLALSPDERDKVLFDLEKMHVLDEISAKLAERYREEQTNEHLIWTRTVAMKEEESGEGAEKKAVPIEVALKRPIKTFAVSGGVGRPVEVFIEPGGEKVCTLCQRCIFARQSPTPKEVYKITLSRTAAAPTGGTATLTTAEMLPQQRRRRKKAVAA